MSDINRDHEDSDFDADALAALARPSGAPAGKTEEDDGVLDLRALASSMAPEPPPPEEEELPPQRPERKPVAESSALERERAKAKADRKKPGAASRPEARPVAAREATPVAEPRRSSSAGIFVGVAIGLAIAVGAFVMLRPDGGEQASANDEVTPDVAREPLEATSPTSLDEEAAVAEPAAEEQQAVDEAVPTGDTEAAAQEALDGQEAAAEPAAAGGREERARPTAHNAREQHAATQEAPARTEAEATPPVAPTPPAAPARTETAPAMEESAGGRDMDALLNQALGGSPTEGGTRTVGTMEETPAAAPAEGSGDLPDVPSRQTIQRALAGLLPGIRQCAGDQVGIATARIRVRNDGSVASVAIAGSPFGGTPQGACMENVVRRARFPRFQRTTFDVTFPFSIRPQQ